ncbi:peptide-methionine (R)-S-oxide reductase MsrB [Amedibacillus sp. YH-ame10]
MKKKIIILVCSVATILVLYAAIQSNRSEKSKIDKRIESISKKEVKPMERNQEKKIKEIYLAGGCFWGLEEYFSKIDGVEDASVGYANGTKDKTSYEMLRNTEHAESVHVVYDENIVSLHELLLYYFRVVDPVSLNKQGNDAGKQYRTGVYYIDVEDLTIIEQTMKEQAVKLGKTLAVEVFPLKNYVVAEEYHQDYLKKNPGGYCHIDVSKADMPVIDEAKYPKPTDKELREMLTIQQYEVTQNGVTEGAFNNLYWDEKSAGIYVDITTGEPLFSSSDKFDSGCGWPSFTRPISSEVITTKKDESFGMKRIEVRSRSGNAHLGHVFDDGPKDKGGLRFCINSASIEFVKKGDMEKRGYGSLLKYV